MTPSIAILIYSKNFHNFELDTTEKQGIINQSSNSNNCYVSIVLIDSEVAFQEEGNNSKFRTFLYCVLFTDCVA